MSNVYVSFWKVNFYHDHTKIIICSQNEEYLLTYINEDRISTTFRLTTLLMSGCSLELKHRMEYALNMLLQRCNWKTSWMDPMGRLFSTVRSTGKPVRWSTECWKRWTGGGTKTIPLGPEGLDGTRPGWGIQFWTLDDLRVNQNAVFLDVPVLKGVSDNFAERCIDSSLCWEHFRQRTWNCEYTSQRGGKGRKLPCCLKAVIGAAFGYSTVNYGHI